MTTLTPDREDQRAPVPSRATAAVTDRSSGSVSDQPNLVLITGDHATWDMVAGRSPARTPNLNGLAEAGLLFERSYTRIAVCCPARAMLATGGYPWRSGIYNQVHVPQSLNPDMRPDAVTSLTSSYFRVS